jgi:hypothetical protein
MRAALLAAVLLAASAASAQDPPCGTPGTRSQVIRWRPPIDCHAGCTGYSLIRMMPNGQWGEPTPIGPVALMNGVYEDVVDGFPNEELTVAAVIAYGPGGTSLPSNPIVVESLCALPYTSPTTPLDVTAGPVVIAPPPPPPTGWPDAGSTGPAAGVTLTSCAAGNITTSKSGCIFPGPIVIAANGVTITDSIVNGGNASYGISAGGVARSGTVLTRVEVFNANSKCVYIQGGFTASKLDLHDCEDGAFGDGVTIVDSWFHDLRTGYPRHPDGFQVPSVGNVVLKGNNFDFAPGAAMNSGIFIQSNFGQVNSALVEGNRFKGAGYHIYVDNKGYECPINVKIRGNTFVRGSYGFGIASIPCAGQTGWEWSGNKYDDGAAVPQP